MLRMKSRLTTTTFVISSNGEHKRENLMSRYSFPLITRYKNATNEDEKKLIANTLIREMAIHSDAECVQKIVMASPST